MTREEFVTGYGGIFEHSRWIAERAWENGVTDCTSVSDVHAAMCRAFRTATRDEQMGVVLAHPDLAGRLTLSSPLTQDSAAEQASAGLDQCTPDELARFQDLNERYKVKFGFPFIMAVRGATRRDILAAFESRLKNDTASEFTEALRQIERIALLRLKELLP